MGVVGPLIAAVKVRKLFKALGMAQSKERFIETLRRPDAEAVAIEVIASDNCTPRFQARKVDCPVVKKLAEGGRHGSSDPAAS